MKEQKMKTMKMVSRDLVLLALTCLLAVASALWTPNANADGKLDSQAIESKANGFAEMNTAVDGPVYVEFANSPALTAHLSEMLRAGGFQVTSDKASARSVVALSGDLVLLGGPVYYKGVKVAIGEATEKTLALARPGQGSGVAAAVAGVSTVALNSAAYAKSVAPALHGLQLSRMADVLGDASGAKSWFNTKVAGDPRGFCLSRCDDWKKVKQAAYVRLVVSTGGADRTIRVQSLVYSEVVAPDEIIATALETALLRIAVVEEAKVITAKAGDDR
jgi:hypothetical protein